MSEPITLWISGIDFDTYDLASDKVDVIDHTVTVFVTKDDPNKKEARRFIEYRAFREVLDKLQNCYCHDLKQQLEAAKVEVTSLNIDQNSWKNCKRKLNEANERIVEFESIKAGHLEYIKQIEDAAKVIARQLENTQLELAAEKAKSAKMREGLEFYAVNGLSNVRYGDRFDARLANEFYINGGYARKILRELEASKEREG